MAMKDTPGTSQSSAGGTIHVPAGKNNEDLLKPYNKFTLNVTRVENDPDSAKLLGIAQQRALARKLEQEKMQRECIENMRYLKVALPSFQPKDCRTLRQLMVRAGIFTPRKRRQETDIDPDFIPKRRVNDKKPLHAGKARNSQGELLITPASKSRPSLHLHAAKDCESPGKRKNDKKVRRNGIPTDFDGMKYPDKSGFERGLEMKRVVGILDNPNDANAYAYLVEFKDPKPNAPENVSIEFVRKEDLHGEPIRQQLLAAFYLTRLHAAEKIDKPEVSSLKIRLQRERDRIWKIEKEKVDGNINAPTPSTSRAGQGNNIWKIPEKEKAMANGNESSNSPTAGTSRASEQIPCVVNPLESADSHTGLDHRIESTTSAQTNGEEVVSSGRVPDDDDDDQDVLEIHVINPEF